jgi:RNA-directed DNA polymerase
MTDEKSESVVVPKKQGNACGGKDWRIMNFQRGERELMHRNEESLSTKLQRIGELAKKDQSMRFTSLAHLLNVEMLYESFGKLNRKAAPGVDGVTMKEFGDNIWENTEALHEELRSMTYRATNARRVYIPKANGKQRPIGIPTVKDRVVQRAVAEIISRIYEPYFIEHSYGFRPGRSCHDAIRELQRAARKSRARYIVEADISSYFDTVNHEWMMKFLEHRIADSRILRIVKKWLNAGFMENGVKVRTDEGTPQGGPISPLLANIYLHYVLDLWFEKKYKKSCEGKATLIRYADDFVVSFEKKEEAERFLRELKDRLAAFNLTLAVDKTRLLEFGKRSRNNATKGKADVVKTFDFLGFTMFARKRNNGRYSIAVKPSRVRKNKFLRAVKEWLRVNTNRNVWYHAFSLRRKLFGYYNYFGLKNCLPSLNHVKVHVARIWLKTLRRRSQRAFISWERFLASPWYWKLPKPARRKSTRRIIGSRMP